MNDPITTSEVISQGYLRPDGRKGIRNLVLVVYTVECAKHVAHAIQANEPDTQVIGFPGCYDNEYAIRLILALARHPNVGAVLCVGLGCEYTQPERIAQKVQESGRPAEWFFIQQSGGTATSIEKGKRLVAELHAEAQRRAVRAPFLLSDLTIGCECGGSDFTSGLAGNPVVGRLFDTLVDAGGTAVFEEIVELIGLRDVMVQRAATAEAANQIGASYDKTMEYCRSVRQFSVSPGNFAGGLTTIEEKSLGAFSKSGSRPIQGVVRVAERPPNPGLWLLDSVPDPHFMQFGYTNPNDTEGIVDLVATGAQVVLFVTGRGSVIGGPIAPLVKITGNAETYRNLQGDMDFDASGVLRGNQSLEQASNDLLSLVKQIVNGCPSKPELLGHHEYIIVYKHQSTPTLQRGCRAESAS
ncbi:MAG: UxaA family hydrolase [Pirellulales bacterium]|nr:UxaA family hydrolase [Pirellulales bacterium]